MKKRNTVQKGIVLEVFRAMHNHPSAGMVYQEVHKSHPEISKATVYRILADWAEEGSVDKLVFSETDARFDFRQDKHYHAVCKQCGAVSDIDADIAFEGIMADAKVYEDFAADGFSIEFSGLCRKCQNDNAKN